MWQKFLNWFKFSKEEKTIEEVKEPPHPFVVKLHEWIMDIPFEDGIDIIKKKIHTENSTYFILKLREREVGIQHESEKCKDYCNVDWLGNVPYKRVDYYHITHVVRGESEFESPIFFQINFQGDNQELIKEIYNRLEKLYPHSKEELERRNKINELLKLMNDWFGDKEKIK